ncbi:MAG: hypothetical protein PHF00_13075, partial [Elusimicrobia bacterium]|nr:hypothetical protein [Elusimicrobiota bacterium]
MRRPLFPRIFGVCALLFTLAASRETALAQFSTPWDPDFAQQPQKPAPPPAPSTMTLEQIEAEAPLLIPSAGPFLLLERPDPGRILETAAEAVPATAPPRLPGNFLETVSGMKPFTYTERRFTEARTAVEEGRAPAEPSPLELIPIEEREAYPAAAVKPPPPELELPSQQMSLSITGRKIIGFTFSEKRYLREQTTTG